MSVGSLRYLFTPELLDSRLVSDISDTAQRDGAAKREESSASGKAPAKRTSPSRWQTIEYFIYYIIVIIVVPSMFKAAYDISKEDHPNYLRYSSILSKGWIPGRKVDNTDMQYKGFRDNIPILFIVLIGHSALRKLSTKILGNGNIESRVIFDNFFAAVFLLALHGISYFKVLFLMATNYAIVKHFGPSKATPFVSWGFNLVFLFLNEWNRGYMFGRLFGPEYGWIDSRFGGIMPRWEVHFNFTMLRIISFNMDYYWALTTGPDLERRKRPPPSHQSDKDRVSTSHPLSYYNFSTYHAYCLYSPLYIAGPIITFNDYVAQNIHAARQALPPTNLKPVILYAVRFLLSLLCMELVLHYCYVQAISKAAHHPYNAWINDTPFQLMMIGYFNLHIIWLKLLIPWRFFRLWSLVDSIDPPENMLRCMSDNYSAVGFWRGWHRSYNRWNIRYLYIPLGGSKKRPVINMLVVFTFVALWHDLSLTLLTWGWLIVLFILPELTARALLPYNKYGGNWWYRPLAAMGGTLTVLTMCGANLVGFALGVDGVKQLIYDGIINAGWAGVVFLGGTLGSLFVGINLMFEIREEEARRGLFLGC
ncbi:glycerol transporter [Orbilia blumenaviensis]|uniref:Glycerol transporter n=1 Tax=Orbilia blumenaviensis TaxID=1796055 RepID=A0AAV9VJL7_9PEZI